MIVTAIQCETCEKKHQVSMHQRPYEWNLPAAWITLFQGNLENQEARHFCSSECLAKSLGVQSQEPIEAPQSKARRFVLVDGDTGRKTNGVLWENRCVLLDSDTATTGVCILPSWDTFKHDYAGDEVIWIDQEDQKAVLK